uniref:Uncharacterized protein n=1 Tax=Fagus sylvatica TaxID=28930 RepID=A0A2N9EGH9_FAGSY
MKLNKSKLRKFAASGEVVAAPASLKHKKTNEGPLKVMEQSSSRPPIRDVVPLVKIFPHVIMVDVDLSLPMDSSSMDDATVNQSPHVAMSRAKDAISQRDMDACSSAHSEDVHYLLVHSLMRKDLAALRAKSIADEAEMKNIKRAVAKLTWDRKDGLVELDKVKFELKARDDDVKAAVEAKDKIMADLKHLVGQIEGVKAAAVSEFRASEAFDDINTRYFLSGFEAFRKQAAEHFLDLDFSIFQPYDDKDLVVDGGQGDQIDDDDAASK